MPPDARTACPSLDDPAEYVLVEAFRDGAAGGEHVSSDHVRQAQRELPQYLRSTPRSVNVEVPQDDWSELGEMRVEDGRRAVMSATVAR